MIAKREGQIVVDSWLKKYQIPIITSLSIVSGIIIFFIIFSFIPKNSNLTNSPSINEGNLDITDPDVVTRTENVDRLNSISRSDDPVAAASEATPEYIEIYNNEESTASEKVTAALQLAKLYELQNDITSVIDTVTGAMEIEDIDSTQKLELLTALDSAYSKGQDINGRIYALEKILELPTDTGYTPESKARVDQSCQTILASLYDERDNYVFEDYFADIEEGEDDE